MPFSKFRIYMFFLLCSLIVTALAATAFFVIFERPLFSLLCRALLVAEATALMLYFPALSGSYRFSSGNLFRFSSGVFLKKEYVIAKGDIRGIALHFSPLHSMFSLCMMTVCCRGITVRLPVTDIGFAREFLSIHRKRLEGMGKNHE